MATMPPEHPLSQWESRFHAAFDTICTAFWTRIESRQTRRLLTQPVTEGVPSDIPAHCSPSGQRAKKDIMSISHLRPCGTACIVGVSQDISPSEDGGLSGQKAPAHVLAWAWGAEKLEYGCTTYGDLSDLQDRELHSEEIEELREAFKAFEKDKDGYISCKDLGDCMRTMGDKPTEMELIELSQQINMNPGGHVDFDDFVELMGPKLPAETADMIGVKELRDAFKEFDTNGDGEISTSELREARKKFLGQQVGHGDIEDIIRNVDFNGDDQVDFEEGPYKMMKKSRPLYA
ncbi:calcium-binding 1 isoform X2 [Pelobates cultripes]|uniref:Calcium-binding 1 isoform X2 n=1 Tax=Pelobates cultripes TaxID=61616 RepID=A0AAD1W129_PELCU|nr:calcium-binding 1 isoform X2 [Pelobates cultripes]